MANDKLDEIRAKLEIINGKLDLIVKTRRYSKQEIEEIIDQQYFYRHECAITLVCLSSNINYQKETNLKAMLKEKSIGIDEEVLTSISRELPPEISYVFENRTPDLYKIIQNEDGTFEIKVCEISVSVDVAKSQNQKEEKYKPTIDKLNLALKRRNIPVFFDFIVYSFPSDPVRFQMQVRSMFDSESYNMYANIINEACVLFRQFVTDFRESVSYQANSFFEFYKAYNEISQKKFIEEDSSFHVSVNDEKFSDMLKGHFNSFPEINNDFSDENEYLSEIRDMVKDKVIDGEFDSGFRINKKKELMKVIKKQFENIKNSYKEVGWSKRGVMFHLPFINRTNEKPGSFQENYEYVKDLLTNYNDSSDLINFYKEIFCEMNENDKSVFYYEKSFEKDEWSEKKKMLEKVLQPRVMKFKNLSYDSKRFMMSEYHIGKKKEIKRQKIREIEMFGKAKYIEKLREDRKMISLDMTNNDVLLSSSNSMSNIANWLVRDAPVHVQTKESEDETIYPKMSDKSGSFEEEISLLNKTNMRQYSNHINRTSTNVLFKNVNTNSGVYLINHGNPNLWVIVFPGLDLHSQGGFSRFQTLIILDDDKQKNDIFGLDHNRYKEFLIGGKTLIVTDLFSFDRIRWEHLNKTNPIPYIALIKKRSSKDLNEMSLVISTFFYAAYSCQARVSAILDNFRYLLCGGLADISGAEEYIREKLEIPVKTAGQVFLMVSLGTMLKNIERARESIKSEEININMEEEEDLSSAGSTLNLPSCFDNRIIWNTREHCIAEMYMAFFLTGKDLHDDNHRTIGFMESVIEAEMGYNDLTKNLSDLEKYQGVGNEKINLIINSKRGGVFSKRAIEYSAFCINKIAKVNERKLFSKIEREKIFLSIMRTQTLTSSKSSLFRDNYDDLGTRTVLESALETSENEGSQTVKSSFELVKNKIRVSIIAQIDKKIIEYSDVLKFGEAMSEKQIETMAKDFEKVIDLKMYQSESSSSSGCNEISELDPEDSTAVAAHNQMSWLIDSSTEESSESNKEEEFMIEKEEEVDEEFDNYETAIDFERIKKEICADQRPTFDFENQTLRSHLDLIYQRYKHNLPRKALYEIWKNVKEEVNEILIEAIEKCEKDEMTEKSEFHDGQISKLSPFFLSTKFVRKRKEFKCVPKGQRTATDREIYIQSYNTRIVDYCVEHTAKAFCEIFNEEAISKPGDYKAISLGKMERNIRKWTSERKGRFMGQITGDMTKYSLHDTPSRLNTFAYYATKNMDPIFKVLMYQLSRSNKRRDIHFKDVKRNNGSNIAYCVLTEKFRKNDSIYPTFKSCSNWLQGMMNYLSSLTHTGVVLSIKKFFDRYCAGQVEIDFMVHSDDWASFVGFDMISLYNNSLFKDIFEKHEINVETMKMENKYNKYAVKEVLLRIISIITFIYKLNNLTVSVKKSSVSLHFVEFCSIYLTNQNVYTCYEKKLQSIFSDCPNTGNKDDSYSIISKAQGCIISGGSSEIVDSFVKEAMYLKANQYSMLKGQKFCISDIFNVPRKLLPMAFFPEVCSSSLLNTIIGPEAHDIILMHFFSKEIEDEMDSELKPKVFNALKLFLCGSYLFYKNEIIEQYSPEDKLNLFPGFKLCFTKEEPKNQCAKCIDDDTNEMFQMIDPTLNIFPPTDPLLLWVHSHIKLKDEGFQQGRKSKNMTVMNRIRAAALNTKNIRIEGQQDKTSVSIYIYEMKKLFDEMTFKDVMRYKDKIMERIYSNCKFEISILEWFMNSVRHDKKTLMKYKKQKHMSLTIPNLSKIVTTNVGHVLNQEYCKHRYVSIKKKDDLRTVERDIQKMKSKFLEHVGSEHFSMKELLVFLNLFRKLNMKSGKTMLILTGHRSLLYLVEHQITALIKNNTYDNHIASVNIDNCIMSKDKMDRINQVAHSKNLILGSCLCLDYLQNMHKSSDLNYVKYDGENIINVIDRDFAKDEELLNQLNKGEMRNLIYLEYLNFWSNKAFIKYLDRYEEKIFVKQDSHYKRGGEETVIDAIIIHFLGSSKEWVIYDFSVYQRGPLIITVDSKYIHKSLKSQMMNKVKERLIQFSDRKNVFNHLSSVTNEGLFTAGQEGFSTHFTNVGERKRFLCASIDSGPHNANHEYVKFDLKTSLDDEDLQYYIRKNPSEINEQKFVDSIFFHKSRVGWLKVGDHGLNLNKFTIEHPEEQFDHENMKKAKIFEVFLFGKEPENKIKSIDEYYRPEGITGSKIEIEELIKDCRKILAIYKREREFKIENIRKGIKFKVPDDFDLESVSSESDTVLKRSGHSRYHYVRPMVQRKDRYSFLASPPNITRGCEWLIRNYYDKRSFDKDVLSFLRWVLDTMIEKDVSRMDFDKINSKDIPFFNMTCKFFHSLFKKSLEEIIESNSSFRAVKECLKMNSHKLGYNKIEILLELGCPKLQGIDTTVEYETEEEEVVIDTDDSDFDF